MKLIEHLIISMKKDLLQDLLKLSKAYDKEFQRQPEGGGTVTYKGISDQSTNRFPSRNSKYQEEWKGIFKILKGKNF